MPRQPRVHVDNSFYHVLARGNNKEKVFLSRTDYLTYLSVLDRFSREHGVLLHAYVLMPNHVHLITQVGAAPLSSFMQVVQQTYTQGFNRRYNRVGHVFQGRYKAFLVDEDAYLLALIRYIHLNPVRAGLAAAPSDYPWSSHHHYATGDGPGRVHTAFVRDTLASYGIKSIEECELLPTTHQNRSAPEPDGRRTPHPDSEAASWKHIIHCVAAVTGLSPSSITSPARGGRAVGRARRLAVYFAIRITGLQASTVARMLGCSPTAVALAVNETVARLDGGDQEWRQAMAEVTALMQR